MGKRGPSDGWQQIDGEWIMPPWQREYLEWFIDPERFPRTQKDWCDQHEVDESTVRRWRKDKRFQAELAKAYTVVNLSPERVQEVIDSMHRKAVLEGDVKAAQTYLQYIGRFEPPKRVVIEDKGVEGLSDEELAAVLQARLAKLGVQQS